MVGSAVHLTHATLLSLERRTGTWIPRERAIELGQQYNIAHLLEPITSYVPSSESPPPAPKHVVAAPNRPKKGLPGLEPAGPAARVRRATSLDTESEAASGLRPDGSEGSMTPSPSEVSSSSRTPSPIAGDAVPEFFEEHGPNGSAYGGSSYSPYVDAYGRSVPGRPLAPGRESSEGPARYAEIILDYFISESTTIPSLLISPPPDFDANMSIDDDEHTALHWACAMGRIRVVKLLLSAGADVFRVNLNGQTALMRAAMFSNNYDLRKFPELFELLHRSILNIDRNDRTVFHHVVDLALSRGKPHASRYYMETMINRLAEYGSQLADILNFQDDEGETPLTMAARARSKRLVRLLLENGADPKIRNKEGRNAEDYIVEDERFRASPTVSRAALGMDGTPALPTSSMHTSEAGQRAAGRCVTLMSSLLHSLADSYDSELTATEKNLTHAHALLAQIQGEIADSARVHDALTKEAEGVDDEKKTLEGLEKTLKNGLAKRARDELDDDWKAAETQIKRARTDNGLSDGQLLPANANGATTTNGDATSTNALLAAAPEDLKPQLESLRNQVSSLKSRRGELLDTFVARAREQGTGKTMAAYRRLIAAGCGGIASDEVDAVVSVLCEVSFSLVHYIPSGLLPSHLITTLTTLSPFQQLLEEGADPSGEGGPDGIMDGARARDAAALLRSAGANASQSQGHSHQSFSQSSLGSLTAV